MLIKIVVGIYTQKDKDNISQLLSLSCGKSTWDQYDSKWIKWVEYMNQIGVGSKEWGNVFLDDLSDMTKVYRIILFMKHLFDKGDRKPSIDKTMTALSSIFLKAGRSNSVFSDPIVVRAKKGTLGSNDEIRKANQAKVELPTLPLSSDMIQESRNMFWVGKGWSRVDLDSKVIWLVLGIGFNFGWRIGQMTKSPRKKNGVLKGNDHCLRTGDLKFSVKLSEKKPDLKVFQGGQNLRKFLLVDINRNVKRVQFCELSLLSGKTVRSKSFVLDKKKIGRDTLIESTILEDLCMWIVFAKPMENDEFTCRYDNLHSRKVVTAGEVNLGIKRVATFYKFDERMFSSRSLRSGLSSSLGALGVSSVIRNRIGGWAAGSTVPDIHYTHSESVQGVLGMNQGVNPEWTHHQVRNLGAANKI